MTHTRIDLAVFDMAGTTIDEGSIVYDALRNTVESRGAHPSPSDLDAVKGMDKITAIRTLLTLSQVDASDAASHSAFDTFTHKLKEGYTNHAPKPMAGVEDVFDRLRRRGVGIALTTGFTRDVANTVLKAVGWSPTPVDALITTDDVPAGRPAPYMIHEAMRRTGATDVRRVISAGDTIVDVQSAQNAGVISVAVLTGDTPEDTLRTEHPDHLIPSVSHLFDLPELN